MHRDSEMIIGLTLGNDIAGTYVSLSPSGRYTLNDETGRIEFNPSTTLGFAHGLEKMFIPSACIYPSKMPFLDRHSITYHVIKQLWRSTRAGEGIATWYAYERESELI